LKYLVIFALSLTALVSLAVSLRVHAADKPRSGEQVYAQFCANCHSGGWQGAPVSNDKNEWEERVAKGWDSLFKNAKQGLNGMPPMGTCMDCSDAELTASIKEMLNF
jgi:cytochrome c5